jgi:hypothetical protein
MTYPTVPNDPSPFYASQLFTVRVWIEEHQDGRKEWRGKVQHVASGNVRYFRDWTALVTYMQQKLADSPATKDTA